MLGISLKTLYNRLAAYKSEDMGKRRPADERLRRRRAPRRGMKTQKPEYVPAKSPVPAPQAHSQGRARCRSAG